MEKIITLKTTEYTAKINLSRGANCISLRDLRYDAKILREPDYTKELDNPFLYGMPILYPVNRIEGGSFVFEGRKYSFPINEPETNCHLHGNLHEAEFSAEEIGETFVRCSHFVQERAGFGHSYKVEIFYSLSEEGLFQKTRITNFSKENMPSFLGFHTTFNIPFLKGARAEDIRVLAQTEFLIERNMNNYLPTGNFTASDETCAKLNQGTFMPFEEKISKHCYAGSNGKIEICDTARKLKVIYENDEKFGFRLFYNGNADGYICLEPMTCMVNCQNLSYDKTGFHYIGPEESREYISKIYVREGIL